jgi:hypothetical protein
VDAPSPPIAVEAVVSEHGPLGGSGGGSSKSPPLLGTSPPPPPLLKGVASDC